jgi:hypothetical protein
MRLTPAIRIALGGALIAAVAVGAYGAADTANTRLQQLAGEMAENPAKAKQIAAGYGVDWCQTEIAFARRYPDRKGLQSAAACPLEGDCDNASVRDESIPGPSSPPLTIRLKFNVFAMDNGRRAMATQADVDAQVDQLNSDYAPVGINFSYTTEFINSTAYRNFSDVEESAMKSAYADAPDQQVNIYVVDILAGYLGVGTFAWDPNALGPLGGIIVDGDWFGAGQKTLTHELGHNLGLWHTHHGVSEVAQCSACWERADGLDGDATGDFCSDTDPTPVNYYCSPPGGTDPCSGIDWGPTDPQNYMGYAADACYTEFSPQQWGRMHCWINSVLQGWVESATPTCDCSARGDVDSDGYLEALDLTALIDHVFSNAPQPPIDDSCPYGDRGDLDCSGYDDALDITYLIDLLFANGPMPCDPCTCDPYPTNCP